MKIDLDHSVVRRLDDCLRGAGKPVRLKYLAWAVEDVLPRYVASRAAYVMPYLGWLLRNGRAVQAGRGLYSAVGCDAEKEGALDER